MPNFIPAFGRWEDPEAVEQFFSTQRDPIVRSAAPDLFTADDNADVDLCDFYEKVAQRVWDSLNQNPVGMCVGTGNAKSATLTIAMMVLAGEASWPGHDVAVEPIYGGMRVEIGAKLHGSDLNRGGDGGVGAWAIEWLIKYGVLFMKKYGNVDLSTLDKSRTVQWGRSGVPDELEPIAKEHPLTQASLCERGEDVWALIGQLHPVVHCSNQGFSMQRSADGTCRAQGSWAHCAGWSGRFTMKSGLQVVRYDNSWDGSRDGSGYLADAPIVVEGRNGPIKLNGNQFLVPLDIVDRMCKSGRETYAMTGVKGFTRRRDLFLI